MGRKGMKLLFQIARLLVLFVSLGAKKLVFFRVLVLEFLLDYFLLFLKVQIFFLL